MSLAQRSWRDCTSLKTIQKKKKKRSGKKCLKRTREAEPLSRGSRESNEPEKPSISHDEIDRLAWLKTYKRGQTCLQRSQPSLSQKQNRDAHHLSEGTKEAQPLSRGAKEANKIETPSLYEKELEISSTSQDANHILKGARAAEPISRESRMAWPF